jgi:hypothetical protein
VTFNETHDPVSDSTRPIVAMWQRRLAEPTGRGAGQVLPAVLKRGEPLIQSRSPLTPQKTLQIGLIALIGLIKPNLALSIVFPLVRLRHAGTDAPGERCEPIHSDYLD